MSAPRRLGCLCPLFFAAACAAAGDRVPVTDDEKALYEVGRQLGERVDVFELSEEELDFVTTGFRDYVLGKESQVDIAETPTLQNFIMARRQRRADAEKKESAVFLAAEAAQDGAVSYESGLVMRVTSETDGPKPTVEDTVKVHYHGTLRDGSVFDSSIERKQPAVFPLGRVIPCWKEAIAYMSVGSKARIVCPSDIAYGDRGSLPTIEPGAALAFDVELLEIVPAKK